MGNKFFLFQVMGLLQVVIYTAASKLECRSLSGLTNTKSEKPTVNKTSGGDIRKDPLLEPESSQEDKFTSAELSTSDGKRRFSKSNIFLQLPLPDLRNLCCLLGREGYSSRTSPYI